MDDEVRPPDDPEILESGGGSRRRWMILAACVLLLMGLASWRAASGPGANAPAPSSTPSSSVTSPSRAWPAESTPPAAQPTERDVDLSWLGAATDYSVFLRTDDAVYRIQPKSGRVIRTPVPKLMSTGAVTFLPVERAALVHPLDSVPSYRVPDDAAARPSGSSGGVMLPGPDPRHVWVENGAQLTLTGTDGASSETSRIKIPSGSYPVQLFPDGHGYVLAATADTLYDLRPEFREPVADGDLIATGPNRLLVNRCDHQPCRATLLDSTFKPVRGQPGLPRRQGPDVRGVISADGRTAAIPTVQNRPVLLLDLLSGEQRRSDVKVGVYDWGMAGQLAFSPDSRWLFMLAADHRVHAINPRSGHDRGPLPGIGGVQQLAIRP